MRRELSEMQKRSLRRNLASIIKRGRERERLSYQRNVSWQEKTPGDSCSLQQPGSDYPPCDSVLFLGQRILVKRQRRPEPEHVRQVIRQLFNEVGRADILDPSPAEVTATG